MDKTWVICPGCERMAPTSRDLTALGCEGRHIEVIPVLVLRKIVSELEHRQKLAELDADDENGPFGGAVFQSAANAYGSAASLVNSYLEKSQDI